MESIQHIMADNIVHDGLWQEEQSAVNCLIAMDAAITLTQQLLLYEHEWLLPCAQYKSAHLAAFYRNRTSFECWTSFTHMQI
jgi:hypothetical protein